jgi:hypothetical protein
MIDHNFNTQEHLLSAKARILGSIQNDRGAELSELEYLKIEIKEIKEKRRGNSMPLIAIGTVISVFSFAANTPLTQITGSLMGIAFLIAAMLTIIKYTQALRELTSKLEAQNAPS